MKSLQHFLATLLVLSIFFDRFESTVSQETQLYSSELYNAALKTINSTRHHLLARHIEQYNNLLDDMIDHAKFKHKIITGVMQYQTNSSDGLSCNKLNTGRRHGRSLFLSAHSRSKRSLMSTLRQWDIGKSMENLREKMDLMKGLIESGKEVALAGTAAYKAIRKEIIHIHNDDDDSIIE